MYSGFAVGGLLGDVFLHLLPEAYMQVRVYNIFRDQKHESLSFCGFLGKNSISKYSEMSRKKTHKEQEIMKPESKVGRN